MKGKRGVLYVVATPIGNLEDITIRAIRILKEVDIVAAEDTRVTKKLFSRYGIKTPMVSFFEHSEKEKTPYIIEKLKTGRSVALVSDAGTPGISDPGYRLIRRAVEEKIPVVAVPGPSAFAAVLSVAGLPVDRFTFMGFMPRTSSARKKLLLRLPPEGGTFVFFDTAARIQKTLSDIRDVLGDVPVVLAREMTKMHEEVLRGTAGEVLEKLEGRKLRGEITLVLRPARAESVDVEKRIEEFLRAGLPVKEIAKALSGEGLSRPEVYRMALRIREKLGIGSEEGA